MTVIGPRGVEEIWAAVSWRSTPKEQALRAHCRELLPPKFVPRRFIALDSLPRNEMGKIERGRLQMLTVGRAASNA